MNLIQVDWRRSRLQLRTATSHDIIKNQLRILLNTEESDFRRYKLLLKDVSYCNFATYEFEETDALEKIGVPLKPVNLVDFRFLEQKLLELENEHTRVFRLTRRNFNFQHRPPTEKMTAEIITAMNDFNLFKDLLRSLLHRPGVKKTSFYEIWGPTCGSYYKLMKAECDTVNPFVVRRETRHLFESRNLFFETDFYRARGVRAHIAFLHNIYRLKELDECYPHRRIDDDDWYYNEHHE
jgi:hypothetical protein